MHLARCAFMLTLVSAAPLAVAGFPHPYRPRSEIVDDLPVGRWRVEFTNRVVEECVIEVGGTASVVEPARSSPGRALARDGATVITFDDDRTERWTRVGSRIVVEHWCPSSEFPAGRPVLGIAELAAEPPIPPAE